MAIYAIGDIQGCYDELQRLLERIRFNVSEDRLWIAGDLVNRGPKSLEVLRFVYGLGNRAITVLGNHDLHLLAVAAGFQPLRSKDTFAPILEAPDREELLTWLRHRPLLYRDPTLGVTLIHAGLPPQWDIATAEACARELEAILQGPNWRDFLAHMYGNKPEQWREDLQGWERLRAISNCLTRLRYCDAEGRFFLKFKESPGTQAEGLMPWFKVPNRASQGERIVFGHWATLEVGAYDGAVFAVDGGCVWGGQLVALRLDQEKPQWFFVNCHGYKDPYQ
ncbi:bis(5'-nucleosyl)-tetraphosphatase (symmetrical) [Nitrosococcus halophilus Nc 4]|uniref:Bis(5'-nucleosyl)-tetraphosphatase, symmetrical n=1 Tax=Nitrosococcus halophilus (strain Nc4) TaxID=472759 RepID=D5BZ94_NITHN|nr:symmetrical bis(5'-nucleosyl)-tetraphosphatase [Nitrosococcus halophilus]ADE16108.1 bis(5'-nucleosyl)-tetraphosphatase (symmetrical) [Nitrosococcus halophilus Nc 4]